MVATADDDADADAEDGVVSHGWIKPASSACTSNSSDAVGTDGDEEGSAVSGAVVSVTVAVVELSATSRF